MSELRILVDTAPIQEFACVLEGRNVSAFRLEINRELMKPQKKVALGSILVERADGQS
jgi:hypothetical protein